MKKSSKISFRLPEELKSFLSDTVEGTPYSLSEYCVHILESYKKGEDITNSTDDERIKWESQVNQISAELEKYKKELSNIQRKYQEQNQEVINYKKIVKDTVNNAYQKGFNDGINHI